MTRRQKRWHAFAARLARTSAPPAVAMSLLICAPGCGSVGKYAQNPFRRDKAEVVTAEAATNASKAGPAVTHADSAKKGAAQTPPPAIAQDLPPASLRLPDWDETEAEHDDPQALASIREIVQQAAADPAATQPATGPRPLPENFSWSSQDQSDPFAVMSKTPAVQSAAVTDAPQTQPVQTLSGAALPAPESKPIAEDPFAFAAASCPTPADCPPTFAVQPAPACPPEQIARPFPGVEYMGDEFVCDGGDKGLPVHYEGGDRAGLDTEDTVVEFTDHEGVSHVKPSTRTCIYAPRFGAVASATLPNQGLGVEKAQGHQDRATVTSLDAKAVFDEQVQFDEASGVRMRSRASGVETRDWEGQVRQTNAARNHVKLTNVYEDIRFLQEGQFDKASAPVIGQAIASAVAWADGRRPVIVAQDLGGQTVHGRWLAEDYTGVEDQRRKGDLTIIKVADKGSAHPGEIVTFTIRFENIGDRELIKVRVVDNLSPRLEYIEGSINSNLDGGVDVKDNGAGGKLLTFQFDQPLGGGERGYVTFQCRVR